MKDFPYKTSFAFIMRPVVSQEKDKYLSKASLEQLSKFIPDFESVNMPTLLPVSFNICVANRVNKNDDVIDTDTAIAIYKKFINSPINLEHKRDKVLGCVLTAGFSEFGTDKILSEEEVKGLKSPFNITLGGIIWRIVNDKIADAIEESNDPTSDKYMSISASWELGFSKFQIVALEEGQKNIEDGSIVQGQEAIAAAAPILKSNGGTGKTGDGKHLYRMPSGDVTPLGCGITESPAADVVGIATDNKGVEDESKEEKNVAAENKADKEEPIEAQANNIENSITNISQNKKSDVKVEEQIIIAMKLNSIKDLTDETIKQITASQVSDLFTAALTEKGKEWEQEKTTLANKVSAAEETAKNANKELDTLKESLKTVQANLDALNKEKSDRLAVEAFNSRMNEISEIYELDDEVRAAIVDDIKAIASDEAFDKWKLKAAALFKPFKKGKKKDGEDKEKKEGSEKKEESCAKEALGTALDNAEKEKGGLPNSSSASAKSLKDKFASNPFAKEHLIIR